MKEDTKKKIPNMLTKARLYFITPAFIITYFINPIIGAIVYGVGGVTDLLDGFLARKWNAQSEWGKKWDPIADGITTVAAYGVASILINPILLVNLALEGVNAVLTCTDIKHYNEEEVHGLDKIKRIGTDIFNGKKVDVKYIAKLKAPFVVITGILAVLTGAIPALSNILYASFGCTAVMEGLTDFVYYKNDPDSKIEKRAKIIHDAIQNFMKKISGNKNTLKNKETLNIISDIPTIEQDDELKVQEKDESIEQGTPSISPILQYEDTTVKNYKNKPTLRQRKLYNNLKN